MGGSSATVRSAYSRTVSRRMDFMNGSEWMNGGRDYLSSCHCQGPVLRLGSMLSAYVLSIRIRIDFVVGWIQIQIQEGKK